MERNFYREKNRKESGSEKWCREFETVEWIVGYRSELFRFLNFRF